MKICRFLAPIVTGLVVAILPTFAQTSVVTESTRTPSETLSRLSERAELVVVGTVANQEGHYARDRDFPQEERIIVTDSRVQVDRLLKGTQPLPGLLVRTAGGCVTREKICFQTDIGPTLSPGDRVLLFLDRRDGETGVWRIHDILDGKQTIESDRVYPLGLTIEEIAKTLGGGQ